MAGQLAPPVPPPPTSTRPAPSTGKTAIWKRWWFWVIALLVVAIIASASGEGPPSAVTPTQPTSSDSDTARVPRLKGLTAEKAQRAIDRLDVDVEVSLRRELSTRAAGTVLAQRPAVGVVLSAGGLVELTIARPLPRVPNVVGLSVTAARNALREEGFGVDVRRVLSVSTKDSVVSQSPSAGVRVRPSRSVTLTVARLAPRPAPQPPSDSDGNCTSGYSPCLTPASDYDCAGGSGDGPEYVYGVVAVTGSDPYGLDADNDGYGCE